MFNTLLNNFLIYLGKKKSQTAHTMTINLYIQINKSLTSEFSYLKNE